LESLLQRSAPDTRFGRPGFLSVGVVGVHMGLVDEDSVKRLDLLGLGLAMGVVAYAGEFSEAVHSAYRPQPEMVVVGDEAWRRVVRIVDGFLTHQFAAYLSLAGLGCSSGIVDWTEIPDHLFLVGLYLLDHLDATLALALDQEESCYRRRWESHHVRAHVLVLDLDLDLDHVLALVLVLVLALGVLIGSPDRSC